jgi:hypothetical protein
LNENRVEKNKKKMIEFDTSKDDHHFDEELKSVYVKNYVTSQYIFKDDTIKTIRDKICCSIKNNPKFGKDAFIIPSRQYLWSEYFFNQKIDKIMIGQKWIHHSSLISVDTEPGNDLRVYEKLKKRIKVLRNALKSFTGKIRREDGDNNILNEYNNYYSNNEIYMSDIYNQIMLEYDGSKEDIKNITDTYLRIYFPKISSKEFDGIISFLNKEPFFKKRTFLLRFC